MALAPASAGTPCGDMAELDLEAVNKQRVALGLQPIPVPQASDGLAFKESTGDSQSDEEPATTLESREAAAHENWQKLQAERDAKAERTKRKDAAKKAREKAQRHQVLKGATFADDVEEELDTKQWLEQQRKRQKKIAKAEAAKKAEEDAQSQTNYTSADLKGLKVSHQLNEFDLDTEQILTLKDRKIGEESDDDELENSELIAKEKLQERLELKKKKPVYNPNDDDGTGEKKMLAQYDEVISGKKRHHFTLDGKGSTVERLTPKTEDSAVPTNRLLIGLEDLFKEKDSSSDYKKASDIKIKKRIKNPNTVLRKRTFDDSLRSPEPTASEENGTNAMRTDPTTSNGSLTMNRKRTFHDMNFDDDDLQQRLARQRAANAKKSKKENKADFKQRLLQRVAEERAATEAEQVSADDGKRLDWTELPERLSDSETHIDTGKQYSNDETKRWLDTLQPEKWHEEQREITIKKLAEEAAFNRAMNGTPEYDDTPMEDSRASEEPDEDEPKKDESIALTEDQDISKGLGSTLKLLRERDLLDKSAPMSDVGLFKAQQQFLAEKREREKLALKHAREERERTRQSDGYYKMSNREREEYQRNENLRREEQEASRMADFYERNYRPEVNLKYIDEHHREMTAKEAFKHLSHQFHGKGSGAGKQEKKLKKIDEEKKAMAKSTLDTSNYANTGRPDSDQQGAGIRMG